MPKLFDSKKYLDRAEWDYLLGGQELFVYTVRAETEARQESTALELEILADGFEISRFVDRKIGYARVSSPTEIRFDASFLFKRRPGLKKIRAVFLDAISATELIDVQGFIKRNRQECRKKSEILVSAVKLVDYLIRNQQKISGLFPRQIPHGQSTKLLLEDTLARRILAFHLGRPQLSQTELCAVFDLKQKPSCFHIYADRACFDGHEIERFHGVVTEDNVSRYDFSHFRRILIVENAETFYPIHNCLADTLVILGDGMQAASIGFLRLSLSEKNISYWGDIDKAGYEILNLVHSALPNVTPLLMDLKTIESFKHLIQPVSPERSTKGMSLLAAEYEKVCSEGIQIEQEQLPLDVAITEMDKVPITQDT